MQAATPTLTRSLVRTTLAIRPATLTARARTLVAQCLLDWLAVTIGGCTEPLVAHLYDDLAAQGGHPQASVFGRTQRLPIYAAALLNGTASHALDFDDVNYAMTGHPTVPVMPALLALAELRGAEGDALAAAFVAGYEFECRVGRLVAPGHYAQGFHATATLGALGAALACAHLLDLPETETVHAIGIAATQAAGLKAMFGTDCKPLHAGAAARIGLQAAHLAARGFHSREDSLECAQGFAAAHGPDCWPERALADPPDGLYLHANLFKYHASCYETHATIEACLGLRARHELVPAAISRVMVRVNPYCDRMCNLPTPRTGLEAKFSLRQTSAFALAGFDTTSPATFSDTTLGDPTATTLRDRVEVVLDPTVPASQSFVRIEGPTLPPMEMHHDASKPEPDLARQSQRLHRKADALLSQALAPSARQALYTALSQLEQPGELARALAVFQAEPAAAR